MSTNTDALEQIENTAEIRSADANAPFISVIRCVPHSYLVTLTNFDPTIQVKYAIYDLDTGAVLDKDKFVLTNQNRFTTNTVLDNCTSYKVVVSARNYPGGSLYHFSDIMTVWCQGDPVC